MIKVPPILTLARWAIDAAVVGLVGLVLFGFVIGRLIPMTGRQTLIIGGNSMEPAIRIGSAVIIESVDAASLRVGDVVTVRVGLRQALFTHRINRLLVLNRAPYLETKGDADPGPDAPTQPVTAVVGRAAWAMPMAGYLLALLSLPIGVMFVLGLGLSLVVTGLLLDMIATERASRDPADGATAGRGRSNGVPLQGRVARHMAGRRHPRPAVRRTS